MELLSKKVSSIFYYYNITTISSVSLCSHKAAIKIETVTLPKKKWIQMKKSRSIMRLFRYGVGDGIRTHDLRDHNPTL